jgi:hypothetical protein
MSRSYLVVAFLAICTARVSADAPGNNTAAELHSLPVSTLLERLSKSDLGPGDVQLLRAVTDLMEKEESITKAPD